MIPRPRLASVLALLAAIGVAASAPDRPEFVGTARVKQHFHKTGDLVEGEEDLIKVIVKWDPVPGAEGYELCHNCENIDEETGAETGAVDEGDGTVHPIEIGGSFMCGRRPCSVMPGMARGQNKFHLRVKLGGELSPWSRYQNFNVQEPGNLEHEEL